MLTRTALGQSSLYSSLARLTADTSGVKAFVRDGQHLRQLCSSSIRSIGDFLRSIQGVWPPPSNLQRYPSWSKGPDLSSGGDAFVGSNPTPCTTILFE